MNEDMEEYLWENEYGDIVDYPPISEKEILEYKVGESWRTLKQMKEHLIKALIKGMNKCETIEELTDYCVIDTDDRYWCQLMEVVYEELPFNDCGFVYIVRYSPFVYTENDYIDPDTGFTRAGDEVLYDGGR